MKCTDLLIQEHKIILRALDVLDHMATRVENSQPVAPEDVETLLRFLRDFADDHHQAQEESALFPELRRTAAAHEQPVRHMLFEHEQERSLVEAIEDSVLTKKGMEFVLFANRLTSLPRNHIFKEDNILFEIVQRSLSPEQDEKVAAELNKFQINVELLADLRLMAVIADAVRLEVAEQLGE